MTTTSTLDSAIALMSGGQDSTTCLYWALKRYKRVTALAFDYGQPHIIELDCARVICHQAGVQLLEVELPKIAPIDDSPSMVMPGRNAIMLSMAASVAQQRGAADIIIGACQSDAAVYLDCRPAFIEAMASALQLGVDSKMRIIAPLLHMTKAQVWALAAELGILELVINHTHTCYAGDHITLHDWGYGCGPCASCLARAAGWASHCDRGGLC